MKKLFTYLGLMLSLTLTPTFTFGRNGYYVDSDKLFIVCSGSGIFEFDNTGSLHMTYSNGGHYIPQQTSITDIKQRPISRKTLGRFDDAILFFDKEFMHMHVPSKIFILKKSDGNCMDIVGKTLREAQQKGLIKNFH